jgi:hypothetical protein
MSLGTDRVRLSFNPGGNEDVEQIKRQIADIIDLIETYKVDREDPDANETNRLGALAQTALEDAAMWAVKMVT